MRTISDIQKELDTITKALTSLSGELTMLKLQDTTQTESNSGNLGKLFDKLKSERGQRHPLEGHLLTSRNDYVRNLYIQVLCTVLLYQNRMNEAQTYFLSRLISGAKAEHDVNTYSRMALEISVTDFSELLTVLQKDNDIKYSLAFDMLLICGFKELQDKQAEFLGELLDAIGITDAELDFMLEFSAGVHSLDETALAKAMKKHPNSIEKIVLENYVKLLGEDAIYNVLCTPLEEIKQIANCVSEEVVISYFKFTPESVKDFDMEICDGDKITFRKCIFLKGEGVCIRDYNEVVFEDCVFRSMHNRVIQYWGSAGITEPIIKLTRCLFSDCMMADMESGTGWNSLGAVVYGWGLKLDIDTCSFLYCGGINHCYYYRTNILSNLEVMRCVNSTFENCWHYHNKTQKDPEHEKRVLFPHIGIEENNKVINSAKLYPGWKPN